MPFKCWFYVCVECVVRVSSNYSYVLFEDHSSQIPLFLLEPAKLTWGWMFLFFNSDPSWWAHPQNVPILFLFEIYIIYQMKLIFMRTNFWEKIFKLFFFFIFARINFFGETCSTYFARIIFSEFKIFYSLLYEIKKRRLQSQMVDLHNSKIKNFYWN